MADQLISNPISPDAEASVAPVSKPKVVRRSRPAVRKPKAAAAPQTVPLAAISKTPPPPPPPPAAVRPQLPKLLPAGHHGPDTTMMYFLSLMLLVIIFFSTLVVVQQVLLVEAKARLLRLAEMTGTGTAQLQGEVASLRSQLDAANIALTQAQAARSAFVEDPDGAFRLPLPAEWYAVLDRNGTLDGLATPANEAVYRIALGPGRTPTLDGNLPVVVAKIKPASAAKYKAYLTNPTSEPVTIPNTDASVKVSGGAGRRLLVIQRGEDVYAVRYQMANDDDKALEQIAMSISFSAR